MLRALLLLAAVCLLVACRQPTAPDPYASRAACQQAGGMWGPWASHYGCKLPSDPR